MQEVHQSVEVDVEVEWLILADSAHMTGGKLYMLGGGWDRLTVNSLPAKRSLAVAIAFRIPWNETNRQHAFQLEISDEDGDVNVATDSRFEVGRPAGIPPGQPQRVQAVVDVDATFEKLGTYVITARIDSEDERAVRFNVTPGPGVAQSNP